MTTEAPEPAADAGLPASRSCDVCIRVADQRCFATTVDALIDRTINKITFSVGVVTECEYRLVTIRAKCPGRVLGAVADDPPTHSRNWRRIPIGPIFPGGVEAWPATAGAEVSISVRPRWECHRP
ncbi:hypothetical protein GCM10010151_72060 [Actinoallomurus spadix]|uniref:Uncharacterized protein n=1 Tax=Actinoallomurus spadix TaxID=79912 RepID=A0ABN0XSH0_9ACTN